MSRGVIFFNHGTKHCARLAVAVASLRQHFDGPIVILDTGESGGVAEQIAGDSRLQIELRQIPFVARRRNSCYCMKSSLWRHSPFDVTIMLDADTLTAGSIRPLFEVAANPSESGFVVTRFSDWITTGNIIRSRILRWRGVQVVGSTQPAIDVDRLIAKSLERPHAAINTGVLAWRKGARILGPWETLTDAGDRTPFTDELSAQLLIREHGHTLVSDRWNCSPIYGAEKDKAIIWHFHGNKQTRPEALPIWWPKFAAAWDANICALRNWAPAGDERLAEAMRRHGFAGKAA